jgi:hypothetical protein
MKTHTHTHTHKHTHSHTHTHTHTPPCLPSYTDQRYIKTGTPPYYERDVYKLHGIHISFINTGRAGKFDIASLTMTLGSSIGLLALATVVADMLLVYYPWSGSVVRKRDHRRIPKKEAYRQLKFAADEHFDSDGDDGGSDGDDGAEGIPIVSASSTPLLQ